MTPVSVLALLAAGGYLFSLGPLPPTEAARAARRWRTSALLGALAVIVLALGWPVDQLAARFQFGHMAQHLLLIAVAAPLLVLAEPWLAPLHLLPRRFRGPTGRVLFRDPRTRRVRSAAEFLAAPLVAWLLFHLTFVLFHIPALYDLTLRSRPVHDLEHLSFLGFAVLFWIPVIRRGSMGTQDRLLYLMAAGLVGSALGAWLAVAPVLYQGFIGASWLSPIADQRLAAGLMGGPGSVDIALATGMILYRWLGEQERAVPRMVGGGST